MILTDHQSMSNPADQTAVSKLNISSEATDREELLSLKAICELLSVTTATGRNWLKLGKLTPQVQEGKKVYFSVKYAKDLKKSLAQGKNPALKSRRNKTYISGSNVYTSYVSEESMAIPSVQKLIDQIEEQNLHIGEKELRILLAECAVELLSEKIMHETCSDFDENSTNKENSAGDEHSSKSEISFLQSYLEGSLDLDGYAFLIDDLLPGPKATLNWIKRHPNLFGIPFHYEAGEDILGLLYLSLKNRGSRKAAGAYYTPTKIVKKLCHQLFSENASAVKRPLEPYCDITNRPIAPCYNTGKRILDPCCGTGNFLLQLPMEIPFENIYGSDKDEWSIRIARINMAMKYGIKNKKILRTHLSCRNYLEEDSSTFAYIIGNPPWGSAFTPEEKKNLKNRYQSAKGSAIESFDVFVEQALLDLEPEGVLSFVLPEAFLNVRSHMEIRKILSQRCRFQYLEYLGDPFHKVHCPCIILQVQNAQPASTMGMLVKNAGREFRICQERNLDPACFCFLSDDEEHALLEKIGNPLDKCFLKGHADFALGIVTGNNTECISPMRDEQNEPIFKGTDLFKYRFREPGQYIDFRPEEFQQVASEKYYRAPEKLLYRFISKQLVFAYDDRQILSLNSCNIVIPRLDGIPVKYVLAVLNSRTAQYYFKKKFNSVKILRSHIQQIPIPLITGTKTYKTDREESDGDMDFIGACSFTDETITYDDILSYTEILLHSEDPDEIRETYDRLDLLIACLYGLTDEEYRLVKKETEGSADLFFSLSE